MSTIAPHQLPTPSQTAAPVPAPVTLASFGPGVDLRSAALTPQLTNGVTDRTRSTLVRRITVAGVAGAVAIALGVAGLGLAGGTPDDGRAAERTQDRDDRDAEEVSGGNSGSNPFNASDDPANDTPTAGNATVDLAATYVALFGADPDVSTADCIQAAAGAVMADVQAVADGTATSVDQVTSGLSPFASCVAVDDFDAAMFIKASGLVAPLQLDQDCALSVLGTFTEGDRLDVLVTAVVDPTSYDQRVFNTFNPCAA